MGQKVSPSNSSNRLQYVSVVSSHFFCRKRRYVSRVPRIDIPKQSDLTRKSDLIIGPHSRKTVTVHVKYTFS